MFEARLPPDKNERFRAQGSVIARQCTRDLRMLARVLVIWIRTSGGTDQADILQTSLEGEKPRLARSARSRWLDEHRS